MMTLSEGLIQQRIDEVRVRYYPQVESTNDLAKEWLLTGATTGAIVVADEQVKGRGRMGRSWYAPPGTALMFSMVMRPPVDHASRITMLGAVAVAQMLEHLGIHKVGLKWPNDIQIDGKKVCGILAEAVWHDKDMVGVILGIGLNVRVNFNGTPFEQTATSIETITGRHIDRVDLLADLVARLHEGMDELGSEKLFTEWTSRLQVLHKTVTVADVHGVVEEIEPDGALIIRTSDGAKKEVRGGELNYEVEDVGKRGTEGAG